MSFPEDPHAAHEVPGQLLLEAFELVSERPAEGADSEGPASDNRLCSRVISTIAKTAADEVIAAGLGELEGDKLGGVQLYDTRKVTKAIEAAVDKAWTANDDLTLAKDDPNRRFKLDIFTSRGRRHTMEDRHIAIADLNSLLGLKDYPPQSWFAVLDGHGGVEAAKFAQAHLHRIVAEQPEFKTDVKKALHNGFLETDKQFLQKAERDMLTCGATAVTVLIRGRKLYVTWLGDSQVAMCKGGQMVQLMDPHKPEREDEKQRITDAEGVVVWYGAWRVNGVLSVSRAIGDGKLKKWVIGTPDIAEFDLTDDCEYLIAGCDGLWDVMDNDKVLTFVKEWQQTQPSIDGLAEALVEHAIDNLSSTDNISIVIVFLHNMTSDAWKSE